MLLVWRLQEAGGGPQVWRQVAVGVLQGVVYSLDEVTHGTGVATRRGVHIMDAGHAQHTLADWGSDKTSTTWGWDQTDTHGAALAGDLVWHGVWEADAATPVSTAHWHKRELGSDEGTTDSGGNLSGALHAQTDVAGVVTDGNEGLEAGTLTGRALLLDWHDLHHFVLQLVAQEVVNDLGLLDWQRVQVDLLQAADLAGLHEAAQLGYWGPATLLAAVTATT